MHGLAVNKVMLLDIQINLALKFGVIVWEGGLSVLNKKRFLSFFIFTTNL